MRWCEKTKTSPPTDSQTLNRLPNCQISVDGINHIVKTHTLGDYYRPLVPNKEYFITASCKNYHQESKKVFINADRSNFLNFTLKREEMAVEPDVSGLPKYSEVLEESREPKEEEIREEPKSVQNEPYNPKNSQVSHAQGWLETDITTIANSILRVTTSQNRRPPRIRPDARDLPHQKRRRKNKKGKSMVMDSKYVIPVTEKVIQNIPLFQQTETPSQVTTQNISEYMINMNKLNMTQTDQYIIATIILALLILSSTLILVCCCFTQKLKSSNKKVSVNYQPGSKLPNQEENIKISLDLNSSVTCSKDCSTQTFDMSLSGESSIT